ncbi:methyltransferase [Formosa sp. Hel1_33_131]|jgi:ubiquinone/menaquinone biosynthesis C-methylase UbiE|uniref:class I SAM-dependent methyltransferase n=1 Tax=Formosa sp. Hel1_33_131 TaxID=1336794 RepID=UPI00084E1BB2|nr:class I SAM-dependent methyltransferase [Formosa sp. Hel1_33_131]AOR29003.1 methyltransferase [Formosa sp. Hel1_33_131]
MDNKHFQKEDNLLNDLISIKNVFNLNSFKKQKIDDSIIKKYYKYSSLAFSLFHSKEGSVHMAINYDGIYNIEGYYTQAVEISHLVKKNNKVLELGCGKGFNSKILAEKHNFSKFYGIDISETQLNYAKKKEKQFDNLNFNYGSFQDIPFNDNSFDIVFAVETLCHSENIEILMKEVNRILKKGGKFIIYDAFRVTDIEGKSHLMKESVSLCEKALAVNKFHKISYWIEVSKIKGFEINTNEDKSLAIMPNLKRLYKGSKKYLKNKFLAKMILLCLPSYLVRNSISGIIMPYTIMKKTHSYNKIIMTKTCDNNGNRCTSPLKK